MMHLSYFLTYCCFILVLLQGKQALKQTPGTGRANITILGVCSATGIALDPLVIFLVQKYAVNLVWR